MSVPSHSKRCTKTSPPRRAAGPIVWSSVDAAQARDDRRPGSPLSPPPPGGHQDAAQDTHGVRIPGALLTAALQREWRSRVGGSVSCALPSSFTANARPAQAMRRASSVSPSQLRAGRRRWRTKRLPVRSRGDRHEPLVSAREAIAFAPLSHSCDVRARDRTTNPIMRAMEGTRCSQPTLR